MCKHRTCLEHETLNILQYYKSSGCQAPFHEFLMNEIKHEKQRLKRVQKRKENAVYSFITSQKSHIADKQESQPLRKPKKKLETPIRLKRRPRRLGGDGEMPA